MKCDQQWLYSLLTYIINMNNYNSLLSPFIWRPNCHFVTIHVVTKVIPLWELHIVRILCNLDLLVDLLCSIWSISRWFGTCNQSHKLCIFTQDILWTMFSALYNIYIFYTFLIFNTNILLLIRFLFHFFLSFSISL